jgi:hypothetical protein
MNSVISVRKLPTPRSIMENHPQKGPKRSKISSAWPRWVAAPEADGHFLDYDRHAESEHYEGQEEADAEFGSGGGVGEHAGAVVFAQHDQDARAHQEPEKAGVGEEATAISGGEDANAVVGAVDIFVGDYYGFGFGLGGEGLHRLEHLQCCASIRWWIRRGSPHQRRLAQVYTSG